MVVNTMLFSWIYQLHGEDLVTVCKPVRLALYMNIGMVLQQKMLLLWRSKLSWLSKYFVFVQFSKFWNFEQRHKIFELLRFSNLNNHMFFWFWIVKSSESPLMLPGILLVVQCGHDGAASASHPSPWQVLTRARALRRPRALRSWQDPWLL